MRNAIKYYYNIDVDELKSDNQVYFFDNYILKELNNNINVDLYNFFLSNNLYLHKIVNNVNNEYITKIDNKDYILMKIENNSKIDINNINKFLIDINPDKKKDWSELWEKKVDYYEKNIINTKNKDILEVFPYYIGLSEIAIRIYKDNDLDTSYSICHNRLKNYYDFYSPDNIITDYKVRDIAEYIKMKFFLDKIELKKLFLFIDNMNLKSGDYVLLYSRLLFPTYFYDCIENNENIGIYTARINQYERFLNEIYFYLSSKTLIPKIDWLIKKA